MYITTNPDTGEQTEVMEWRYHVDASGTYLGRWDVDALDRPAAGEVPSPPPNYDYRWNADYSRWELPSSSVRKIIPDVQHAEAIEQMMDEVRATLAYLRSIGMDIKRRTPQCRDGYARLVLDADTSGSALVIAQAAGATDAFVEDGTLFADISQDALDTAASLHDPLQGAITAKQSAIYQHAKAIIDAAVADYSGGEMAVWADLEREARQYQTDGTVGPLLQSEINKGQRDADTLAAMVIAKADALHTLRTNVIAERTRHCNAVAVMTTVEDVVAYDHRTGWTL